MEGTPDNIQTDVETITEHIDGHQKQGRPKT